MSRYRLMLLMWVALMASPVLAADGPTPYPDTKNASAWPGKGPIRLFGWMVENRNAFWKQREKDQGKVVFVGDSLTAGWKPEMLAKHFPDLKIANRGIGGDVSRGLLFRFKEDVLDLKPSGIVLCIGANDLSAHGDPAAIEGNIKAMIAQAKAADAAVPILISLVPPRDSKEAPMKPGAFKETNDRLAKLADESERVAVIDPAAVLADADGKPIPELFAKDRLHIAGPGYAKWAEAIKPALEKIGVK